MQGAEERQLRRNQTVQGIRFKVHGLRQFEIFSPIATILGHTPYTLHHIPFCYLYAARRNDRRQHRRWCL